MCRAIPEKNTFLHKWKESIGIFIGMFIGVNTQQLHINYLDECSVSFRGHLLCDQ